MARAKPGGGKVNRTSRARQAVHSEPGSQHSEVGGGCRELRPGRWAEHRPHQVHGSHT